MEWILGSGAEDILGNRNMNSHLSDDKRHSVHSFGQHLSDLYHSQDQQSSAHDLYFSMILCPPVGPPL